MDNEEKRARLDEYVLLMIEVENMEDRLSRLRSEATLPPVRMGDGSGHTGGNGDRMERAVIRLVEYENKVGHKIKAAREEMRRIESAISAMKNPMERSLMRMRYIDCDGARKTKWSDIAISIFGDDDEKDLRATYRLHASALSHIVFEEK